MFPATRNGRQQALRALLFLVLVSVCFSISFHTDVPISTFPSAWWTARYLLSANAEPGYPVKSNFTTFLAHEPGFSVIENLYWRNNTFYIVTDQPWHVPDLSKVAWRSLQDTTYDPPAVVILSLRGEALGKPDNKTFGEHKTLGQSLSYGTLKDAASQAVVLPSPMLLCNDDSFVNNYYHWIGEMFLGSWRLWSNFELRLNDVLPPFKTIALPKIYRKAEIPEGVPPSQTWDDPAGANDAFTKSFFPKAEFEFAPVWAQRANTSQLYRIPLALLADRKAGHNGPMSNHKPWGDVLRLPVPQDWLLRLRRRFFAKHKPTMALTRPERLQVTYLSQQGSKHQLFELHHKILDRALRELESEGLVDYEMLQFNESVPLADQVAKIALTDFLIGLHGPSLTHILWMDPGEHKTVFELSTKACSWNDYSPLALASGVNHYFVREDSMCTPHECPPRGCGYGNEYENKIGLHSSAIKLQETLVVGKIREVATKYYAERNKK